MFNTIFLIIGFSLLSCSPAYSYVDPGILGGVYQLLYIIFFGVIMGAVTRPWLFLKGLFKKQKPEADESEPKS